MEKYYYLHVWGVLGFDSKTQIVDRDSKPIILDNIGLEIDYWPPDDLFSVSPLLFVTERLKSIIVNKKITGGAFDRVTRISQGANFRDNYPDTQLPSHYWKMTVSGQFGQNDMILWEHEFLLVSKKALECFRANHVTHAEADDVNIPVVEYFKSDRKYFWMSENAKNYFLKMGKGKH